MVRWWWGPARLAEPGQHGRAITAVKGDADYADRKYSEWVYKFEKYSKGYFNDDIQSLDFYHDSNWLKAEMTDDVTPMHMRDRKTHGSIDCYAPMPIYGAGL